MPTVTDQVCFELIRETELRERRSSLKGIENHQKSMKIDENLVLKGPNQQEILWLLSAVGPSGSAWRRSRA